MKKITLALAAIAAFFSTQQVYSQAYISMQAPVKDSYSQLVAPTGDYNQNYMRGCFLITASELQGLTVSSIASLGFLLEQGTASGAVSGNMTLYLQNTNDFSYNKSYIYSNAIAGMTNVYSGNMLIPAVTTTALINLSFPSQFNYTGGGIYVAYNWASTSPASPSGAFYASNNGQGVYMGAYRYSSTNSSALNSLYSDYSRPVCRIGGQNNATNELSVLTVMAPGQVAEALHVGHTISAQIKNASANALNNVNVGLSVTGANNFSDSQLISSIPAGAIETVTFTAFNPTLPGINNIQVSVPSDQNNSNNSATFQQSMNCNKTSNSPWDAVYGIGIGFTSGSGISSSRFNFSTTTTLTAVNLGISTDFNTQGAKLYGVLVDENGVVVSKTNTITVTGQMLNSTQTFSFIPYELTANTDYYIGMASPYIGTSYYPMALDLRDNFADNRFFSSAVNGGVMTNSYLGYFAIEPILATPPITITQASTVICQGESMTLMASGSTSYSWTSSIFNPIDTPTSGTITVTPTSNEIYHLNAIDAVGCGGTASAPLAVNACVGIKTNAPLSTIKIYPNPAVNSKSVISGLEGTTTIQVYNMLGALVSSRITNDETAVIDLTNQPNGNYLVRITDAEKHSKTVKIVNQN